LVGAAAEAGAVAGARAVVAARLVTGAVLRTREAVLAGFADLAADAGFAALHAPAALHAVGSGVGVALAVTAVAWAAPANNVIIAMIEKYFIIVLSSLGLAGGYYITTAPRGKSTKWFNRKLRKARQFSHPL